MSEENQNPPPVTIPVIVAADLKFYHSGGYYNNDPRHSLGGDMSSFLVTSGSLNGLFDGVSTREAAIGDVEYRCIYLKNTNQSRKLLKAKLWVETTTSSASTSVAVSVGSAGYNGVEPMIPNESVAPPMQFFSVPFSKPDTSNLGDIFPGDSIGLWIRWTINPGTQSIVNDYCVLRLDGEREPQSIDTEPEPPPPPAGGCPTGTHWNPTLNQCRPITEPVICPTGYVYDESSQMCVPPTEPPPQGCPNGYHWDPVSATCVPNDVAIVCPIGWVYNETTQRCQPTGTNPPPVAVIKFGAVSDTTSGSDGVFSMFDQQLDTTSATEPSFLLHSGDTTHSDGDVDPFIEFCQSLGTMFPNHIFPSLGNHDDSEDGSGSETQDLIDAFPAMGPNGYYAVTRRNIRCVIMNTQEDYDEGSAQHTFVSTNLQQADADANIKWIIVTHHKPSVGSAGNHAFLSDFRDTYAPLFDQYHVDFILTGHNHVYSRTKPLKYNSSSPATPTIVVNQSTGTYTNIDGRTYMSVASGDRTTGGGFSGSQEAWIAYRDGSPNGGVIFTLGDNGNQMLVEHRTEGGQVDDTATYTKPGASTPPPTTITCPSGYHWDEALGRCVVSPQQCPSGQHWDVTQQRCVPDIITPPPDTSTNYPVSNVEWYYDSNSLLDNDAIIAAGDHGSDGILLSSGASGVSSCEISNEWLYIDTGGGNGRVYFDYHLLPRYDVDDQPGFNIAIAFKFRWINNDSISVKDGNHGTGGWSLDGDLVFGGFGYSFHATDIQSQAEYWHNFQGIETSSIYPGNRSLTLNGEYKTFATIRTDRVGERVVLNVWLDFNDGSGWTKVMTDRTWSKSTWDPGSVPPGDDQTQIEDGPSYIKRHHIWIRNNVGVSGDPLPITQIKIGTLSFIS